MKIKVLLFGVVRDLLKSDQLHVELPVGVSVAGFKELFCDEYRSMKQLKSFAIAVNESYANDDLPLREGDVIAIIPPVSGG